MVLDFTQFFSQTGSFGSIMGEFWVFVIILIVAFSLFLYSYGLNGREISFFVLFSTLYIFLQNVFELPVSLVQSIVVMILIFVGFYLYKFFSK